MYYYFEDYPEFTPNLSPRDIFVLGSFGGTYWRPIFSRISNKNYKNQHKKFPKAWWEGIPNKSLIQPWEKYDKNINRYKVKVGTTLEYWEDQGWIKEQDPYGWVEWYCHFFNGRRSPDDQRQVKRWLQTAGPNSRFRKNLIKKIKENASLETKLAGSTKAEPNARYYNDYTISPKIRQTLQHWAYQLIETDLKST